MFWGCIATGVRSQLIAVEGSMTALRTGMRSFAVPLVQQRQLTVQQENARPHVARVCRDFLAIITSFDWNSHH